LFKLVGPKKTETSLDFFWRKTFIVALKELEDVVDNERLEVDLVLVI
jgi:hypothetical protein